MTDEEGSQPSPKADTVRRRRPWLAAALSALWPGMGQLYTRQPGKAIFVAAATIVLIAAAVLLVVHLRSLLPLWVALAAGFSLWAWGILDASIAARKATSFRLAWYNRVVVYLAYAIAVQLTTGIVKEHLKAEWIRAFRLPSLSMHPTLYPGDYFFIDARDPMRGLAHSELLVLAIPKYGGKEFVERVVGLPGDRIEIHDKIVFRNGAPLREPYAVHVDQMIRPGELDPRDNLAAFEVPPRSLWVLGDNRDNSNDSRYWGPVPRQSVVGRPFLVYWSWDQELGRVRWERIGMRLDKPPVGMAP